MDNTLDTLGGESIENYIKYIDYKIVRQINYEECLKGNVIPLNKENNVINMLSADFNWERREHLQYLYETKINIIKIEPKEFDMLKQIIFGENEEKISDIIIQDAINKKSTDIHFEPDEDNVKVRYRINGCMTLRFIIEKEKYNRILSKIKLNGNMDITEKRRPQDGKIIILYEKINYDLRISVVPLVFGEKMVIRILYCRDFNLKIEDLKFTLQDQKSIKRMINISDGLIIINGQTGAGKSTTVYTMLNELSSENINIITIENPVEVYLKNVNQMSVNDDLGVTFNTGLRSILRQDPDVIMIGEIRDNETAQIAVRASITGHKVLSTIHCRSPREVFIRMASMGIEYDVLFECLKGIISQRLVKILCDECKVKEEAVCYKGSSVYKKCGCEKCNYTGYSSRRLISSVCYLKDEIKNVKDILENKECLSNKSMKIQLENLLLEGKADYNDFVNFIEGEGLDEN